MVAVLPRTCDDENVIRRSLKAMGMSARMLRYARRRAGLTQRGLAAKSGVPQETIARIEASRSDPRVETLDRLLEACGMGLEALPRLGIGVDRTQFQALLDLTPGQRLEAGIATDRNMIQFLRDFRWVAERE
jgi:transcriptional regulator with XRE-family HTH domain